MTPDTAKLPLDPSAVLGIVRDLRAGAQADRPIVVAGGGEIAASLRRELARGGVESMVRDASALDRAAALVCPLAGRATDDDVKLLRSASRASVPIVAVVAGRQGEDAPDPPYVLAENVVRVRPGSGFPVEDIARAIARALGEAATPLAARLPVLRDAVVDRVITQFARQNAVVGVAVFMPGADLPVLTMNQVRMLMRIADAYGFELDRQRLPEVLGVIGSGLGFRAFARQLLGAVPIAGWAVKGGIAYGGTRALGEAARRYFEARAPVTRVAGDRAVLPR
ncbi:MAG TPA: hypothetical protein VLJ76_07065 [Gaiellaceae bacterium]|nr:hypothetical protein [Gaiellaceae bacterium]